MSSYGYQIARNFLRRRNARHIGRYPQVACFAFDAITLAIHLDGRYEHEELEFLAETVFPQLPNRSACLDLGANIGNHSLHFAEHFDRVIAFEPHPRTFGLLKLNADLVANVVAINCGVSSAPGRVTVSENRGNMGASSIGRQADAGGREVSFELRRVDDIPEVLACGAISFVKIDVEGHELEALKGAAETLRRHQPVVAIEALADEVREGSTAALDFLRSLGYSHCYELCDSGWVGKLPRRAAKAVRALISLVTGVRARRPKSLRRLEGLAVRNYPMLLCATRPLA